MSFEIVISPDAERDIEHAFNWYEEQEPGLGNDFLAEVRTSLENVVDRPLSFPQVIGTTRRALITRFPFAVFFVIADGFLTVTACVHQRRNPRVWKTRRYKPKP